jgi:hypothetical protein
VLLSEQHEWTTAANLGSSGAQVQASAFPRVSEMEVAMDVTLERPIASVHASFSVWFAGLYAALIAARQAQADALIAQHLKDLGFQARKQSTEN